MAERTFPVFVYTPPYHTKVIHVRSSDTIGAHLKRLHLEQVMVMVHGQIANQRMPMQFYNIQPKDTIIVLREDANSEEVAKWMRVTEDSGSAFANAVQLVMNRKSRHTALIRSDIVGFKLEMKPRAFRRAVRRFVARGEDGGPECLSDLVVTGPSESISDEPLPVLW